MRIRRTTRRGAGMVEYGLLVGLIAVGAIVAVDRTGNSVSDLMSVTENSLEGVTNNVAGKASAGVGSGSNATSEPTGCQNVGDSCDNSGLIYAGEMSNGRKLYIADTQEQEWAPSDEFKWSDALTGDEVAGADSFSDGAQNTTDILADANTGHPAAERCETSTAHGESDWYLPAFDEAKLLRSNRATLGFPTPTRIWTSTENTSEPTDKARRISLHQNAAGSAQKTQAHAVRCVIGFGG